MDKELELTNTASTVTESCLVTIVITPRDRYSKVGQCIEDLYTHTNSESFELIILDLGYPCQDMRAALTALAGRTNYRVLNYGLVIPIEAMRRVREELSTKYVVFLDNDTRVLSGWLPPLIDAAEAEDAAVVSPVVLEAAGVDEGAGLRNHLFTTELHVVDVAGVPYLIEHKTHRRALPEELPEDVTETEAFELHAVMFRVSDLRNVELPLMTIREHLDIGMQLRNQGRRLVVQPRSRVLFDNLGSRARLSDLRYFNLRWNSEITEASSRLFERRWGYNFYSEESIYNWAKRRRIFMILRWLHVPIPIANLIDRAVGAVRRRLFPVWDPLKNPEGNAVSLYDSLPSNALEQRSHAVN